MIIPSTFQFLKGGVALKQGQQKICVYSHIIDGIPPFNVTVVCPVCGVGYWTRVTFPHALYDCFPLRFLTSCRFELAANTKHFHAVLFRKVCKIIDKSTVAVKPLFRGKQRSLLKRFTRMSKHSLLLALTSLHSRYSLQ